MLPKIALIILYFGKLPFWFPAFQISCRYNQDIDWLIFTDNDPSPNCPVNIKFIKTSLDIVNKLASEKLKLNVKIESQFLYKICDFKLTFGKIFEGYLDKYDFWGHCDIDIVWGSIRKFIDNSVLKNYDIITSRVNRISGHFCLYRNIPKVNEVFMNIPNFSYMIENNKKHYAVDEEYFSSYLLYRVQPNMLVRFNRWRLKSEPFGIRVYWEKILTTSGKHQRMLKNQKNHGFHWYKGRTFLLNDHEIMYVHFHKIKQSIKEINFGYQDNPDEILITKSAILQI
jgi:hypothetical protein